MMSSLVKRVKSYLPQSSWISRWFGPEEDEEEDQVPEETNPDISEDEDDTSPNLIKQTKSFLNAPLLSNSFPVSSLRVRERGNDSVATEDFADEMVASSSGLGSHANFASSTPFVRPSLRSHTSDKSTRISTDQEPSTSTADRIAPRPAVRQTTELPAHLVDSMAQADHSSPRAAADHLQSPRSLLFSRDRSRLFPHMDHRKSLLLNKTKTIGERHNPSFHTETYLSPDKSLDSSVHSLLESTIYSGPITYGGAYGRPSAHQKGKPSPRLSAETLFPRRSEIKVKSSVSNNESGLSQPSSKTARRLAEFLEQWQEMSTPVKDALRIPMYNSQVSAGSETPSPSKRLGGPPTRPLYVPTVPDIIKWRVRQKLQDSTEMAKQSGTPATLKNSNRAVLDGEYRLRGDEDNMPPKHTGKVKSKQKYLEEERAEIVNLPNIALPITSLPRFDFGVTVPGSVAAPVTTSLLSASVTTTTPSLATLTTSHSHVVSNTTAPPSSAENTLFKFSVSSPITKVSRTLPSFTFRKPLDADEFSIPVHSDSGMLSNCIKNVTSKSGNGNNSLHSFSGKSVLLKNNGQNSNVNMRTKLSTEHSTPSSGFVPSGLMWDCTSCSAKNLKDKKICFCGKERMSPDSSNPQQSEFGAQFKMSGDVWECDSCMVRNKDSTSACVACTTPRPKPKPVSQPTLSATPTLSDPGFGAQFKMSGDVWECDSCMVRNKDSTSVCVSCTTPRPKPKTAPTPANTSSQSSGFGAQFKMSGGMWECDSCMVRNKESVSSCVACTAPRPKSKGTQPPHDPQTCVKTSWNCSSCKTNNPENRSKCLSCNCVKLSSNISPSKQSISQFGDKFKQPPGSWSCGVCMLVNKKDDVSCVACENPRTKPSFATTGEDVPKFKFNPSPESKQFKFGIDKASDVPKEPSNIPVTRTNDIGFKFGETKGVPATTNFSFGIPPGSDANVSKSPAFKTPAVTSSGQIPSFSFGSQNTLGVSGSPLGFAFSVPQPKPAVGSDGKGSIETSSTDSKKRPFEDNPSSKLPGGIGHDKTGVKVSENKKVSFTFQPSQSFTKPAVSNLESKTVSFSTPVTTSIHTNAIISSPTTFTTGISASATLPVTSTNLSSEMIKSSGKEANTPFSTTHVNLLSTPPVNTNTSPGQPSTTSNLFSFGSSKQTTTTAVPQFGTPSKDATPGFAFGSTVKQINPFGDRDVSDSPSKKKMVGFGNVGENAAVSTPSFGAASTLSSFVGSAAPMFSTTSNATTAPPSFGSSATTAPLSFGASTTTASFGSATSSVFGTEMKSPLSQTSDKPILTSPPFNFGATQSQPFSFTGNQPAPDASKTNFGFGSSSTNTNQTTSFVFGAPNTSQHQSTAPPAFAFGSGSAPSGASPFGATSVSNSTSTTGSLFSPPTSTGFGTSNPTAFNFGLSSQQPSIGLANFPNPSGVSALTAPNPSQGFAFGQPSAPSVFNPHVKPSFNFTGGETPTFTSFRHACLIRKGGDLSSRSLIRMLTGRVAVPLQLRRCGALKRQQEERNPDNEVALCVSHSSLMSSDRLKPWLGDWVVTIDYPKEAASKTPAGRSHRAPEPHPDEAGLRPWPGALAPNRHRLPPGSSVSSGGAHHTVSDASVDKCWGVVIADAPYDRVRTGLRT
uniref:Nuclear pore complex protein Nup153 n=1 Tax=Timema douglasi TaxID=61478 RepID=A0A7R8ZCL3_TIMDO|nr:unnamed protein product [Timema douglasi]